MPLARRPFLAILAALVALAALVGGCGSSDESSSSRPAQPPTATATTPAAPPGASARTCLGTVAGTEQLRVTGIGCDAGRGIVAAWASKPSCSHPTGASRFTCLAHDDEYRCLGAATARGIAVSCARPGSSAAFIAKRD